MKRKRHIIYAVLLVLLVAVNVIQPLHLISKDSLRCSIHLGKKVPVVRIIETNGGYECYVNNEEYFWLSAGSVVTKHGDKQSVKFHLGKKTVIERKDKNDM